jgi:hypothetical protein
MQASNVAQARRCQAAGMKRRRRGTRIIKPANAL